MMRVFVVMSQFAVEIHSFAVSLCLLDNYKLESV